MKRTHKVWMNVLFLATTMIINILGALGVVNGLSQKQVSDMYPTLITPSPITFSIWSVIYFLLIISFVSMVLKKENTYYQHIIDQISILFWVSCLFNMAWIVAFSYVQIELSVVFITGLVITLSLICQKLLGLQAGKHWLLPLSFGLYTGWLFIATVVNIAAVLVKLKWNRFGIAESIWASIILIFALILVIFILSKIQNAVFPLPVAWAYFGIYQFLAAPEGYGGNFVMLQTVALVGMAVLIGAAAIKLFRNQFALLPNPADNKPRNDSRQ